ncbi:MAG: hypothetical protein AABP62_30360 [Planctomycetota bacterium]
MMTERGADSHGQLVQDIRAGIRKTVAHVLFWQLGPWSRDKKEVSADADMVLVRAITGTIPVVCVLGITIRVVIAINRAVVVSVVTMRMSVFVSVNACLPRIDRVVVVRRVRCHTTTAAGKVLCGEGNEHHD